MRKNKELNSECSNWRIFRLLVLPGALEDCWFIWNAIISTFWDSILYENEKNDDILPYSQKNTSSAYSLNTLIDETLLG